MSFSISLTGLNAAQTELSALSNNIANVGTNGFKKSRVEFGDIVSRSVTEAANQANGQGVAVMAVKQLFTQGGYQSSNNALDLLLGGQGFFMVKGGKDDSGNLLLSRNGSFSVDKDRWVIDNEGRRLQVFPTTADGTATATGLSALQPLRLPESSGVPVATTEVRFTSNLPAGATAPTVAFDVNNPASYNHAASTTVYDADGNAHTATLYYVRQDSPPADTNKYWEVHSFLDDSELSSVPGPGPEQLTFDSAGTLVSPATPIDYSGGYSISFADSTTLPQPFASLFTSQNGYAPGKLESIDVERDGVIRATFSNGETQAIGQVALGNVINPQGLKQNGNVSWMLTGRSGELQLGRPGDDGLGTITSGALETSNIDLTEELVGLIAAQRNFQANARAIDTESALMQTVIQLRS